MRKTFQFFFLPIIGLALASSPALKADTVFSDFITGQSYAPNGYLPSTGQVIQGPSAAAVPSGYIAQAVAFTPTSNYTLSQIDIALQYGNIGSNLVNLALAVDNGSGLPGTVLETWTGVATASGGSIDTVNAASSVTLSDGTQYWLEVLPGASDSQARWDASITLGNAATDKGSGFVQDNTPGVNGAQLGAFDVLGNAVATPEPASVALTLGGIALAAGLARKRRKA